MAKPYGFVFVVCHAYLIIAVICIKDIAYGKVEPVYMASFVLHIFLYLLDHAFWCFYCIAIRFYCCHVVYLPFIFVWFIGFGCRIYLYGKFGSCFDATS